MNSTPTMTLAFSAKPDAGPDDEWRWGARMHNDEHMHQSIAPLDEAIEAAQTWRRQVLKEELDD